MDDREGVATRVGPSGLETGPMRTTRRDSEEEDEEEDGDNKIVACV